MGRLPLNPEISPRIELNHKDPVAALVRDEEWACPECEEHYCLDVEDQERICIGCALKKAGKTSAMFFGWTISKTSHQVFAQPPLHRVDNN
jgi:hypothetical protein